MHRLQRRWIGYCGGVFAGVRLLTSFGNTDMEKAAALSYGRDIIDVYSNSWGPPDSGYHAMKPGTLSTLALKQGVNEVLQAAIYSIF